MKNILYKDKYKGFTLIELLIVMVIMITMSIIGFTFFQSSKNNTQLTSAQREIAATIKQAQSYALQGRIQEGKAPCGYGIRFTDATSYEMFYKLPVAGNDCSNVDFGTFNLVESGLQLENGVVLKDPVDFADTEIYFSIPFGRIYGKNGTVFGGRTLVFQYPAITGDIRSVEINSMGSISEN